MNLGKNLSHAYIISARPDEGFEKATELSAAMLCERGDGRACGVCRHCKKSLRGIHPDVMVHSRPVDDKGKPKREIPVATVRGIERYDANVSPHVHFVCSGCDEVIDLHQIAVPQELSNTVEKISGCHPDSCQLSFTGLCSSCYEKNQKIS